MAKELPYFRFTSQEWQNGDVTFESMDVQGVFINACTYYWISNCCLSKIQLIKRMKGYESQIETLIETGILKIYDGFIVIAFLDKQWEELTEYRKKKQIAGRKGGKRKSSNAKAQLQHNSSYKEKDNDKEKDSSITKAQLENKVFSTKEEKFIDDRIERAKQGDFST